jgi:rod shape determining protein RodA
MRNRGIFSNIDWLTVMLYLTLVIIGWLSIYAATYNEEQPNIFNMHNNSGKQAVWIAISFIIAIIILIIDSKFYTTFAYFIYGLVIVLLAGVLIFGTTIKGSKSWITFGSYSLQPAEFAKFAVALALSKYLSGLHVNIKSTATRLIAAGIIAIPAVLVLLQGDTGSMLVFSSFILVLFREGLSPLILILIFAVALLSILALVVNTFLLLGIMAFFCLGILFFTKRVKNIIPLISLIFIACSVYVLSVDYVFNNLLKPHQRERIDVLLGKETDLRGAGYNLNQSLIAIGSGGLTGKGFLRGTQTKFNFVPEQSTDFIFCTIGEEHGFVGSMIVLLIFFGLLYRIIYIAERQRSKFTRIYAYSVMSILFFHITINVGMTIGLMPVIGIPLPFVSYGGSSMLGFTILLFILLKLDSDRLAVLR